MLTDKKRRIAERLAKIEANAVNVDGFYVLDEGDKTTVFCDGLKFWYLEQRLNGRYYYSAGSTVWRGIKEYNKYGYCLTVKKTAKKTLARVMEIITIKAVQ